MRLSKLQVPRRAKRKFYIVYYLSTPRRSAMSSILLEAGLWTSYRSSEEDAGGWRGSRPSPPQNQGAPYVRYSDVIARNTARYDARLLGHIGSPESTMARGRASSRVARPLSAVAPGLRWLHGDAQLHASLHCPCDRLQKGACKRAAAVPLQFSAACTRALVAADVSELLIELQAIES